MTIQAGHEHQLGQVVEVARVITFCSPKMRRAGMISVSTIAKPEKIAPATKNGGKIVECQPGTRAIAKSVVTMLWTESTSGVASPASRP